MQRRFTYMVLGGVVALMMVFGAYVALAQGDGGDVTPTVPGAEENQTPALPEFGRGRRGPEGPNDDGQALADALGITLAELQAAREEARQAAIDQAMADGLLTQEQADEVLANGFGIPGHHFGQNGDTYLAEALGISEEALQAARLEVQAARLADMVAAGLITQEQADLMLARKAVQGYVDREALQSAAQAAYEEAVAQALADGVISQAQADQLLKDQVTGFPGFGDGFPGFGDGFHGHHGPGRGPGGFRGFGPAPDTNTSAPTTGTSNNA